MSFSLSQIQDRVDVNVYFYPGTSVERIFAFQDELALLPEIASLEFVSQEDVLIAFRERHAGDFLTLQALDELNTNPLGAVLNIRAFNAGQYEAIDAFIQSQTNLITGPQAIIEKVNFRQNEQVINRLNTLIRTTQSLGFFVSLFFIIISILISFNTIRLAIYNSREEIGIMRLVGAQNRYIRGPFVVEGLLYGVVSTVLTVLILIPVTLWLSKATTTFFGGLDLFAYYINNLFQIFLILLVVGMLLGMISSFIAVRRYLKV
ncbi:MAG: permease-like cell division protein FtsX [Candidatus Pacebacteria bacterium]|nr:permease-like cell division protein FtsX [Candidatus Paceibacterota bacterium]